MPTQSRWSPKSEVDIDQTLAAGILEEDHHLDFKAEVDRTRGGNNELARDLAQFAIDSGALLIGVAELDKKFVPTPINLEGLPERVEQVAQSVIDPPLFITTRVIDSEREPGKGYLYVEVPASSTAPHQVAGIYFGRGDKTRSRLGDAEVRRLHAQQALGSKIAVDEVRAYVLRDPVPHDRRSNAHLFIVAVPATPRPEMLVDVTAGPHRHELFTRIKTLGESASGNLSQFSPSLREANRFARRMDGAAFTDGGIDDDRTMDVSQRWRESSIELEMTDEGTIRLLNTRFSDARDDDASVLFELMLPVLARQVVDIAGKVSEHAGYGGQWHFAVVADGIAGLPAHLSGRHFGRGGVRLGVDRDEYEASASAATAEVLGAPWEVARRLSGRFVRSLGVGDLKGIAEAISAPQSER